MSTIRCTVSNCTYWGQNNFCKADQILVMAPQSPLQVAERHGQPAEQLQQTPSKTRMDTLCYTFEMKGQPG